MTDMNQLHGVALSTEGPTPLSPLFLSTDGVARSPKGRSLSGVNRISVEAFDFSVFNPVSRFAAELKIEPQLIDAPGAVPREKKAPFRRSNEVIETPCISWC